MTIKQLEKIKELAKYMRMPTDGGLTITKKMWRDGYNKGLLNICNSLTKIYEAEQDIKELAKRSKVRNNKKVTVIVKKFKFIKNKK